jgi:hypothetical protein
MNRCAVQYQISLAKNVDNPFELVFKIVAKFKFAASPFIVPLQLLYVISSKRSQLFRAQNYETFFNSTSEGIYLPSDS